MNINDLTLGPLKSVSELIDLYESLHNQPAPFAVGFVPPPSLAFRGQPRQYASLVPSFQRQFSRQSYPTAELIENRLIRAFREHYASLPDRSSDMPGPEKIGDGHDLECLSVMQHYEIPTRLLDWTSDFWTAVYFATASDPGDDAELWFYDRSLFDAAQKENPPRNWLLASVAGDTVMVPGRRDLFIQVSEQLTPRMRKQAAHHTVSSDVFADHAPLLNGLLEGLKTQPSNGGFKRYLIAAACKPKTLQFLAEHRGITASTVFPDVVGLGRFLRWQLESLKTMML